MTIQFVTTDAEAIFNALIIQFQLALDDVLYPGDERRIFLEQQLQALVGIYNAINETGKQNLLRYATGEVLDAFGERTGTTRLAATASTVTLRYTLSGVQGADVTIPAGTRATPDGVLFFALTSNLVIAAGQTYADAIATATVTGEAHNGFTAGQINQIVDPVAHVASAANTSTSAEGANEELDDNGVDVWTGYRGRIQQAPTGFSTAGPTEAYLYWAKTANSDIADVSVISPTAGQVKITVLMEGGVTTSAGILAAVLAACSDKKRRPLTDEVITAAPTETTYNITATYYISSDRAAEETAIRSAIENAGGAVDQYKTWQCAKLGRAINPDYLRQLLLNAGAHRLTVVAPTYTTLAVTAVAKIGTVTLTYGGLE